MMKDGEYATKEGAPGKIVKGKDGLVAVAYKGKKGAVVLSDPAVQFQRGKLPGQPGPVVMLPAALAEKLVRVRPDEFQKVES